MTASIVRTELVLVGLGATGVAIGQSLVQRADCSVVGAMDISPQVAGRDLGHVLGTGSMGVGVVSSVDELPSAAVAVVATSSWMDAIESTIAALVEGGLNVVSICEEMRHPFLSHPQLAARLDELAKKNGVTVIGTGCNPGMLMDTLPLLLSGLTQKVRRVTIRRTAQMGRYGAILAKFGLGLTPDAFAEELAAGRVMGHVGFAQSIAAIADGLGWTLDRIVVDPVRPDILATTARAGDYLDIDEGTVAGVLHRATGMLGGAVVIELVTRFGIFETGDDVESGDHLRIEGVDQDIDVTATGGYESFLSTVAMACNVVAATVAAPAGLRTMSELPVAAIASSGHALP